MRKALIKKQFSQLAKAVTLNPKTGARRKKGGVIGMTALFVMCWFSLVMAFFGMTAATSVFFEIGLGWFFFATMFLAALVVGILFSVATVVSTVYNAKDNELLLSMPIRPKDILFARLFEVWVLTVIFVSMVAVPTLFRWFMNENPGVLGGIFSVLLFFCVTLLSVALSGLLGWAVALIASKMRKAKNFMTVFLTLLFLTVYYVFYFRVNKILQDIVAAGPAIAAKMEGSWNPIWHIGLAAKGNVVSFLYIAAICVLTFVALYLFLSKSFLKIATANKGSEKRVYREKAAKASNHKQALFRKELQHFLGSPAYMLNAGLGIVLMVAGAVLLVIKRNAIRAMLLELIPQLGDITPYIPAVLAIGVALIAGLNDITAPSISIEAHNLWISKSMPITAREFFDAKITLHRVLTVIPALLVACAAWYVFGAPEGVYGGFGAKDFMMMVAFTVVYVEFQATAGIVSNLLIPNMTWTNETVAVKQGLSVLIIIFGSMILVGLLGLAFWLLRNVLTPDEFLTAAIVVLLFLTLMLRRWLYKGGAKRYELL